MPGFLPLTLALHPLVPLRTPRQGKPWARYGYQLRVADGHVIAHDDPLLRAFAASVEPLEGPETESEAFQLDAFDPGRAVRLVREGVDEDGDDVIGIWDVDELRRAGALGYHAAARVAAALDQGMAIDALVLSEIRSRFDDRRTGVELLVYPTPLVTVDVAAGGPLQRPKNRTRPRLVLIADQAAGLRWWDPSGAAGPMELDAVPISPPLADELRGLASALKSAPLESEQESEEDFFEGMNNGWRRHVLGKRARSVWEGVRRELGRRYAIGLMLNGMAQPAWTPEDLDEEDDDEIEF